MKVDFKPCSKEHQEILKGKCPDCGGKLKVTAQGGLSLNKLCQECGHKFNDMWAFGSERI